MNLGDLAALYGLIGVGAGITVYRRATGPRGARIASVVTAVLLWPLWMPIVLASGDGRRAPESRSPVGKRVSSALEEGVEAAQGTPLERLLGREAAARIQAEVDRVCQRREQLLALLRRSDYDPQIAQRRLLDLEQSEAPPRTRASARLHLDNVRRLAAIAERDRLALEELASLVEALRTQLVLVRLAGSPADGVGDIVGEVWSRVEGLAQANDELEDGAMDNAA